MVTGSDVLKQLVQIPEAVALKECEAKAQGQEPCPVQYDDQGEWCLPCLATKSVAEYLSEA